MFRVDQIGRKGLFSRRVRLVAEANMTCEKYYMDDPTSKVPKPLLYRANFTCGETITVKLSNRRLLREGDLLSPDSLSATHALDDFLRKAI